MGQCANDQITVCQGQQITLNDLFQNVVGNATITGFKRAVRDNNNVITNNDCTNLSNSASFPGDGGGQVSWTSTSTAITVHPNTFSTGGLNNFDIIVCGSDNNGVIGPCLLNVTVLDSASAQCANVGGNCLNPTLSAGTLVPSDFQSGATSFTSNLANIVSGQTGIQVNSVTTTAINVSCLGSTSGTINVVMQDGTTCPATISCGTVTGNCLGQAVNAGTLSPSDFQAGATSFTGNPSDIVQGQTGIQVNSVTSTSINISCTGITNGSITVRMQDGTDCTAVVNCGTVGGGCLGNTINAQNGVLTTILPSDIHGSQSAFASPAVVAPTSLSCVQVMNDQTDLVRIMCNGTCTDASITFEMANGDTCTVPINCQGTTVSNLACGSGTQNVALGGSIPSNQLATGGTQPYTITGFNDPSGNLNSNGTQITTSASATAGSYPVTYFISDSNGGSVNCSATVTITGTTNSCVNSTSTVSLALASITANQSTVIIANVNPTGAAYSVVVKSPNGGESLATQTTANNWTWSPPSGCVDGAYTVCLRSAGCPDVIPTNSNTILVSGCTTTACSSDVVITFSAAIAGTTMTATATGCDCAGCAFGGWTSLPAGASTNGNVASYFIPEGTADGTNLSFAAECCGCS